MICRICTCEIPAGSAVYLTASGKKTNEPACRECVEREVRAPHFIKPTLNPDWKRLAGGEGTRKRRNRKDANP